MVDRVPASLLGALADLVNWLDATGAPAMIIGGVAASVLGRPRLTQDIDALVCLAETHWADALATAADHGILSRVEKPLELASRSRVLLLRHQASSIDIDLIFGALSFEQTAIDNAVLHDIGGLEVRLPRVEDLLIMKAIAHRPKDLEDIDGLLTAHPEADIAAVRRQVGEFSQAAGMSDILEDLNRLLARHAKNQSRGGAP